MTELPKNYKKRTIGTHELKPETLMMSYGYAPSLSEGSVKPPVFLTSTFVFNSAEEGEEFFHIAAGRKPGPEGSIGGLVYSRFNHPNVEIIEDRLAIMEGSESCVAMSSGMGAISSVLLAYLRPGDVILHSSPLYGGTETLIRKLMPEFGIHTHSFSDGLHEKAMLEGMTEAAKSGPLKLIFIETPANPTNALVDFKALTHALSEFEKAHGYKPVTACDNTMLGPYFQQAVPNGIDLAMYSLTKYIGGHSDLVAGAVCGSRAALKPVRAIRNSMGLNLDPHTSWMISRSLETLVIRMQRAADTGRKVAEWIASNPYKPAKVYHPDFIKDEGYQELYKRQCTGPGSTFSFVVDAPKTTVFKLINTLSIFKSAVSLGGSESLVCHPATTTHSGVDEALRAKVGVSEGLVRLSIGLEHPDDLIVDMENAFKTAFS
jgi:methionine-gamma-lyase